MTSDENAFVNIIDDSTRGGYYLFVGNTLATIILFVSSIVIAQLLGPADYGFFSLVISVPSLIIGLTEFGLTSTITKFLAEFKSGGKISYVQHVIKLSFLLEIVLGLIGTVICFVFSTELSTYIINTPEATNYVKLASILILFQTIFNGLSAIFVGLDKMGNNAVIMIIRAVTKLILSAVLVFFGFSITGAVVGHLFCYVIAVGFGVTFVISILRKKSNETNSGSVILKSMLKYGLPIYGAGLLGLVTTQYQTIIVAFFASKTAIGNFQVTALFQTILTTIVYPFTALFPAFSKLDPNSSQLNQFFRRSVKYTALLLVPCSMAIIVMSTNLVYAFYGPSYTLAPTYVAFTTLTYLFAGIGSAVFGYLFKGIRRTDVTLKSSLITMFVFIPLAPLFTVLYNIIGLIVALSIAQFCSLLYLLFTAVTKLNLSIDLWSSAKIYICSAISALFSFLLLVFLPFNEIINLFFGGALFFFVYITLLPALGVLTVTDIEIFRIQFHKLKSVWPLVKILLYYEMKVLKYIKNKRDNKSL